MNKGNIETNVLNVNLSLKQERIGSRIVISLLMRTFLFFIFGAIIVGLFTMSGYDNPLKEAEKWWPFQAILTNITTFFILRQLLKKEGIQYRSIFNFKKGRAWKDIKETIWLLLIGIALGAIPLYIFSYLLLGSFIPPDTMFQPIPSWALVIAVIIFPLSNGLVETPTYIGYALPRIYKVSKKLWIAIIIAGIALALQHIALPLVFDIPYMAWRFLSFLPLAIGLGFIFTKTNRLLPIAAAHFLMDLQLIIQLWLMTVK
ncbi:type II CAAX prenyl endopeptidase Rce1 family protein [Fredinandcohnia humi]